MKQRRVWPIIRRVWITLGLGATAIFVTWSLIAYRASSAAKAATQADSTMDVTREDGVWSFDPRASPSDRILVFFPGALVDPRAYAPLGRAVAAEGFRMILVELPRRGAFGGAESPELRVRLARALASVADSESVVLGGHSRGAVVASSAAAGGLRNLGGMVLIGTSHPRDVDLSDLSVPVTKIVGTRDGLASPAEVRQNEDLLPDQTRWIWVEGGNHSQFGWYGFQPMDRRATIPAAEQREIMIEEVLDLLRGSDTVVDTPRAGSPGRATVEAGKPASSVQELEGTRVAFRS
jgi:predicted alpha/beta-hydrolase family hydrolase